MTKTTLTCIIIMTSDLRCVKWVWIDPIRKPHISITLEKEKRQAGLTNIEKFSMISQRNMKNTLLAC